MTAPTLTPAATAGTPPTTVPPTTVPPTTLPPTTLPPMTVPPTTRAGTALRALAGSALVSGPVLFLAGLLTAPPQDSLGTADYITSLARDPFLTQLSALLLHYGLIATSLGLLAVPGLVRGRRGSVLTLVGSLGAAVAMLNISGAVKDDWWRMELGNQVPMDTAVSVSDAVDGSSLYAFWSGTEPLAFLGVVLVLVGLARAGVTSWWLPAVAVLAFVGTMVVPVQLTLLAGAVFGSFLLPLVVVGVLGVRRARAV